MNEKPKLFAYIRFSATEQEKGDSIRRQSEGIKRWAGNNGYSVDEIEVMEDRGKSAFHGQHLYKDAEFGQFHKRLQDNLIPKGSILIVESLDRLSRARSRDASDMLKDILRAGTDVITLDDGRRYNWEKFSDLDQILTTFIQSRAHEESLKKSMRIADRWAEKHRLARETGRGITRKIPAWLRLDPTTGTFHVIEERAAIIRRIFQEAQNGDGVELISRRLNREDVPPWGTSFKRNRESATPVWNKSYIAKILTNGAVCGRYVPSTLVDGKRTPQEAIESFYPAVIDKDVFLQTREAMSSRTLGAGRTGRVSNLFPHLIKCGYCGENAQHVNKGANGKKSGAHGGEFLACGLARVGKGCEYHGLPYRPFERAFLEYCREVDLTALLQQDSRAEAIVLAQADMDTATGALKATRAKIDGLLAIISKVANPTMADRLAKELDAAGAEQEARQRDYEAATIRLEGLKRTGQTVADHVDSIREILGRLEGVDGEEKVTLRKKLKHTIARAVEKIVVYPNGLGANVIAFDGRRLSVKPFLRAGNEIDALILEEHVTRNTGRNAALVLLRFRNGHSRVFRWDANEHGFTVDSEVTADSMIVSGHDFSVPAPGDHQR